MGFSIGFIKFKHTNKIHECNMVNNQDYSYGRAICGAKWTTDTAVYSKDMPLGLPEDFCQRCFKVAMVNGQPVGVWDINKE